MSNSKFYPCFFRDSFAGNSTEINDYKMALLSSAYTYSAAHTLFSDVSGSEVSGTGYTAGGAPVTLTPTLNGADALFEPSEVVWEDTEVTARYCVIYNADNGRLVMLGDFEADVTSEAGESFRVNVPSPTPKVVT